MKRSIRQRVGHFIDTVTVNDILSKTDLKQANLYRVKAGENFRIEVLEKIFIAYPNLSPDWVIKGIGEMWQDSIKTENYQIVENQFHLNEDAQLYRNAQNTEGVLENILRRLKDLEGK